MSFGSVPPSLTPCGNPVRRQPPLCAHTMRAASFQCCHRQASLRRLTLLHSSCAPGAATRFVWFLELAMALCTACGAVAASKAGSRLLRAQAAAEPARQAKKAA